MFNHKPDAQAEAHFDNDRSGYVLTAVVDIPAGAEICTNYGMGKKLSNYDLFMNYGFLYEPNEANEIQLVVDLDNNDPEYREKIYKLEKESQVQAFNLVEDLEAQAFCDFIGFCRYRVLQP